MDCYKFFIVCKKWVKNLLSKKQRNNTKESQYDENDFERLREKAKNKYRELSEERNINR